MNFLQVVTTCLDFSVAYNGTIEEVYTEKQEKIKIQSRIARTEILVEREADDNDDAWELTLLLTQNSTGEKTTAAKQTVSTKEQLLTHLSRFWRDETTTTTTASQKTLRLTTTQDTSGGELLALAQAAVSSEIK